MNKGLKDKFSAVPLIVVPFLFVLFFLYFPVFSLIRTAFIGQGQFTADFFRKIFTDSYFIKVFSFTLKEAFISAILTLVVGFPGAYIVSHYNFRFKTFLMSLTTIPFVLPSVLVSLGFIILFGRNGIINSSLSFLLHRMVQLPIVYSFLGIILVHTFYNFPIVLRIIGTSWQGISEEYSFAAKSLGANRFTIFWRVTFPMLLPSIVSSFSLVFIFCFLSFVIIMTIGGAQFATMEVAIYMYYNTFSDFRTGSVLALIQSLILTLFVFLYLKSENMYKKGVVRRNISIRENKWSKTLVIFSAIYLAFVFVLIIAPMVVVIANSFINTAGSGFTLNNFKEAFSNVYNYITGVSPVKVVFNSVLFALTTVLLSNLLAFPSAYYLKARPRQKSVIIPMFMSPIVLSPLTIALSYILTFQGILDSSLNWVFIVISHTLIAFPFVLRTLLPVVETTSPDFVFVARSLGMSRVRAFFSVDLKLLRIPLIASSIFAFAISMGEFGATLMLFKTENTTIPIALFRFLSGRHFGVAGAMGTILLFTSLLAFVFIDAFNQMKKISDYKGVNKKVR